MARMECMLLINGGLSSKDIKMSLQELIIGSSNSLLLFAMITHMM